MWYPRTIQKYLIVTSDRSFTYHRSLFTAKLRDGQLSNKIQYLRVIGLRNRHYGYGFSTSIGNVVNGTEPRISTNSQKSDWHLTSTVPWHRRCYEYEILIASHTDNIHDLEKERWLFGEVVDHVGIFGSKAAKGFSAFNVCLVIVKIMTCNKKFPPRIKYKNSDHETQVNVDLTLIRHFCVSWLINLL